MQLKKSSMEMQRRGIRAMIVRKVFKEKLRDINLYHVTYETLDGTKRQRWAWDSELSNVEYDTINTIGFKKILEILVIDTRELETAMEEGLI